MTKTEKSWPLYTDIIKAAERILANQAAKEINCPENTSLTAYCSIELEEFTVLAPSMINAIGNAIKEHPVKDDLAERLQRDYDHWALVALQAIPNAQIQAIIQEAKRQIQEKTPADIQPVLLPITENKPEVSVPKKTANGYFIAIEGINGSGKSTQAALLAQALEQNGHDVVVVREPGSTRIGEHVRSIVKESEQIEATPLAQLMLYNAARAQMIHEIIMPALLQQKIVIADRYVSSTVAYQGFGQKILPDTVRTVCDIATNSYRPNLTILLDMPVEEAISRTDHRRTSDPKLMLKTEFHKSVRDGFLAEYQRYNHNDWALIDASQTEQEVTAQIQALVEKELQKQT